GRVGVRRVTRLGGARAVIVPDPRRRGGRRVTAVGIAVVVVVGVAGAGGVVALVLVVFGAVDPAGVGIPLAGAGAAVVGHPVGAERVALRRRGAVAVGIVIGVVVVVLAVIDRTLGAHVGGRVGLEEGRRPDRRRCQ